MLPVIVQSGTCDGVWANVYSMQLKNLGKQTVNCTPTDLTIRNGIYPKTAGSYVDYSSGGAHFKRAERGKKRSARSDDGLQMLNRVDPMNVGLTRARVDGTLPGST